MTVMAIVPNTVGGEFVYVNEDLFSFLFMCITAYMERAIRWVAIHIN